MPYELKSLRKGPIMGLRPSFDEQFTTSLVRILKQDAISMNDNWAELKRVISRLSDNLPVTPSMESGSASFKIGAGLNDNMLAYLSGYTLYPADAGTSAHWARGVVTISGTSANINTYGQREICCVDSTVSAGAVLFLSGSTAGFCTTTRPTVGTAAKIQKIGVALASKSASGPVMAAVGLTIEPPG